MKLSLPRRALVLGAAGALAGGAVARRAGAGADEIAVPIQRQIELLDKVVGFDRHFAIRVGGLVRVLVLTRRDSAESTQTAGHLVAALGALSHLGGVPHERVKLDFQDATSLHEACKAGPMHIVYLTPGLDADIGAIAGALTGLDVLSVSAIPSHVASRIVLGFELVSGKAKLAINLAQARLQNVAFRSDILKLARIYN